tara:strand:- start:3640 stop:4755 length:1116 start_codon:yes stop_codon:yes gene_type:complete
VTEDKESFPQNFLSDPLRQHKPYIPGEQPSSAERIIKLNTNENPYPPSPSAGDKAAEEIKKLNLYPNPRSNQLRKVISSLHQISMEQVIVGNGSDDLLNLCVRGFADSNRSVGMLDPSYSLYEVLASIQGAQLTRIPFASDDFELPLKKVTNCSANLFFLTSPHAPSGRAYQLELLDSVAANFNGILVIDEAYADFAQENAIPLLAKYPNVIITRTLSKSYSLAGLRVGYAMGNPSVIQVLDRAREVYNLDRIAQAIAQAALEDQKYFKETKQKIIESRIWISDIFAEWGWRMIPSATNFIFCKPLDHSGTGGAQIANSLYSFLSTRGILVRYFPQNKLTESYIRISIGMPEEMSMLVSKIKEWQHQGQLK